MQGLLHDKVILVTGASKGIGRQIAATFATNGSHLVINGRNEESLTMLQQELMERYSVQVMVAPYDVRDKDKMKETFTRIKATFGRLDGLVNNAGVLRDRLLGMIDESLIQDTFATNLSAQIYHMQFASRFMIRQKSGSIVNLSSIMGRDGAEGQVVYGASKAGVIGATKSAAKELAPYNIRVNAIAPGFIDTEMARSIPENKFAERIESIKMKRIGTPEDVANTALYLCSDLSSYVTGQVIGVDGGMTI
ncbi:SDR family NAD(P)-dependent oxidoreductase [Brevibacillus borstelensis]|jgi:3-oxoacyl-[acyl-carrier protein] reductase|uniref:SDR family NAD(P)-dependent oxidoreductase n=1 Tax=Brevibacillus borstelensis TaxID=45462 RepID=UPI002E207DFD|nr:SDR family NAD(P)-dependent oxidoreductase [Brevibacillus borstelensis]MED2007480.1 SDR family NAD(P)-dependent oxidoreductase [Brevibacillus borstelensis]